MRILVAGAGAWGTALAISAATRHEVTLWARDPAQAAEMARLRENRRYLSGAPLPPSITLASGGQDAVEDLALRHDLVLVATPVAGLRTMLGQLASCPRPVAWVCKGFEAGDEGLLGHEVRASVAPALQAGVLSGPSFADEVARARPTALVAASEHAAVRDALVAAFHSASMRIYTSDDVVGVEVGGAVKNVLAIAAGLCDGLGLGLNARAALITRGLAEMSRLGAALGARAETFMGLSGLGDLVLTCTGDLSRNRKVGLLLAQGRSLPEVVESLGHVAEGVHCARAVVQRAERLGVEMPIAGAVVSLLSGDQRPEQVVATLMARQARSEQAT
jgi:glycerol-3-phosphate dehydrogenase (NAD(P)+)